MKRVTAILLCLILCLGVVMLAACNGEGSGEPNDPNQGQQAHVHTFKTDADWSKDASGHWYDATCDCADVTLRKLQHVDDNKDAICDVCKFVYDHEHTYAEDWTADCTNHWYSANCGCIIAGAQIGAHADENGDGECDVCSYVIENLHNHYFATEWSSDAENHWHAALCEHSVEVADKAAHTINDAGYCTVCDAKVREVDRTNILEVLKAAVANNYKVTTGTVIAGEMVYDTGDVLLNGKTNKVFFVLGNGDSYVEWGSYDKTGTFIGIDEYYLETLEDGTIFAVQIPYYDGTERNDMLNMYPVSPDAEKLNGYNYIPGNILSAGYEDNTTLAQTLANLYDILVLNVNVLNPVTAYDAETGTYSFAYSYFTVNKTEGNTQQDGSGDDIVSYYVEYFDVVVGFTVDDNFVIDNATFVVNSYRNLDGVDVDLTYDPETNTVTLLPTKSATTYAYVVAQTSGERTYSTIYPKASLVPQGFEIFTGDAIKDPNTDSVIGFENKQVIGDTLTITEKKYFRIYLGDPYPITSSFAFLNSSDVTVTWTNDDPNSTGKIATTEPYYSWSGNFIGFMPKDNGSYTMTITIGEITKTVKIVIDEGSLVPPADTANTKYVVVTDTYGWADEYTFTAPQAGKYTFKIPANLGFVVENATMPVADPFDPSYVAQAVNYEVELGEGETLTFSVGAKEKGIFAIGIEFVAGDVGGGDEGGDFDYETTIVEGVNTLYFSSAEITANAATRPITITVAGDYSFSSSSLFVMSVTDADGNVCAKNPDYTITLQPGEYFANFAMFSNFGVSANTPQTLNLENKTASGGDEGGDTPTSETFDATYYAFQEGNVILTVDFNEDGTVVFSYLHPMMPSTYTANYSISEGVMTLTDVETGEAVHPYQASVVLTSGVPTQAGYNGFDYALSDTETPPAAPDAPEAELSNGDNTVPVTGTEVMTNATFVTGGAGIYYITVGDNAVVIKDGYDIYTAGQTITVESYYAGEEYIFEVNSEDYTEGTVNINVVFVPKAEDEPEKDALAGTHKSGDYTLELSRNEASGIYYVMFTNADETVFLTFTYTLTNNGDNTYTLSNLVNVPNELADTGVENIDSIVASNWTISIDPVKEQLSGTYLTIDGYNVAIIKNGGVYVVQIETADYETCYYFTYTVTDNGNNTLKLAIAYFECADERTGEGADKDAIIQAMSALDITITFDAEKEELIGTEYTGIDGYDGYSIIFIKSDGQYYAYASDVDYMVQLYFTYTITEGTNGSKAIALTYISRPDYECGVDQALIDTIEALTITVGGLEGDGTDEAPYVIESTGDYVAPYQGGYVYPYFQFTAPANGYVIISSTYANFNLQYGKNIDVSNNNMDRNGDYLNEIKLYVTAGTTVYFNVADNTFPEEAVDVPFTVAFEEFASEDTSFLKGEWNGAANGTPYTFNFSNDGTGTGSFSQWGRPTDFTINYTVVDGNTVLVNFTTGGRYPQEFDMTFTYDAEAQALTGDAELIKAKKLSLESYQINAVNDKYIYIATTSIVLELKVGASIMAGNVTVTYYVNGEEIKSLTFNEKAEVELGYGDQLVVVITANTYSSLTVSKVEPLGSQNNPIKIEELPFDMSHPGNEGEKYYSYTATEDIILTITCPAGCLVSGAGVSKNSEGNYVVTLTAGQSLTLNPWANTADTSSESTYTYTITGEKPVVEEPDPEQPGQGGEDSGEIDGTYVCDHTDSGTSVSIVFTNCTATEGTVAITRVSSYGTTTTYNCTYTIDATGRGTLAEINGGGTPYGGFFMFDANGKPLTYTYSGTEYVLEKQ